MQYDKSAGYRQEQDKYGNEFIFKMKQAYHKANILSLVIRACERHPAPRILELGPGLGELAQLLIEEFPHAVYHAIDIDQQILARVNARYHVHTEHIETLEDYETWQPESFQAIVGLDVWEHLPSDQLEGYTRKSLALLAEGGIFIAQVPNWGCPLAPNTLYAGDLTHTNHFNEFSAKQLLLNAGASSETIQVLPYRFPMGIIGMLRRICRAALLAHYKLACFILGVPRLEIMTPNLIMVVKKN
jgi:SAM-dependent methyltransferase